jgi:L-alanine-DL-glutamate epimerase-like enolase superfamily enzyme
LKIKGVEASAFRIPLEAPESDGTFTWDSTTVVVAEVEAGGVIATGFTYGPKAGATLIEELLRPALLDHDADVTGCWDAMVRAIRNVGRPGVASMAIAAVDAALWDLKGKLLNLSVSQILGTVRESVPIYGSGGFTSYPMDQLTDQMGSWVDEGIARVKMKIGTDFGADPEGDIERVTQVRKTIGHDAELMVDANGGYSTKQAVKLCPQLSDLGVTWFEEPVSSDDLEGLKQIRDSTDIEIAAGEYGYDLPYFERMASFVDVLQVDASRCAGITEFMRAAAVAAANNMQVSTHTAQSLHVHPACSIPNLKHVEYFADHAVADRLLFDGVIDPKDGSLSPDLTRPGLGLDLKVADAERFRI